MATPSIADAVRQMAYKAVLALHTALPGRVVSYDRTTQTADVQPLLRFADYLPGRLGSLLELPVLPDVLVCMPRAGSAGMHVPLAEDDLVLLIFCSRSIAVWRANTATQVADTGRVHTVTPLESAVALPLMHHDSQAWAGDIVADGTVNIGASGAAMDFVALAAEVKARLDTIQSAFDGHTHPTTATVSTGLAGVLGATLSPIGALADVASTDVKVS